MPPSNPGSSPPTPSSLATSAKYRKDSTQDLRGGVGENSLVDLATTSLMDTGETSALVAKTDSGSQNSAAEPSKRVYKMTDDAAKALGQGVNQFVLGLMDYSQGTDSEDPIKVPEAGDKGKVRLGLEAAEKEAALALVSMSTVPTDSSKPANVGDDKLIDPNKLRMAAAREQDSNSKFQDSLVGIQQAIVERLEKPTRLAASATTSDKALANALRGITISKADTTATTIPELRTQLPTVVKPSPANPFYRSDMTLGLAAQNIVAYFREAADWLNFWHISTSASVLLEMSRKSASIINRIFTHLVWTAEFLRLRRTGWDLRHLPDNFFEDVLPLIMVTCGKLEKLGAWKGCEGMMSKAWRDAEEIREMLVTVKEARVREGKERWARGLGLQEGEAWDKGLPVRGREKV